VRFDGALFFANASYLDEQVLKFRNDRPNLRYILLDARGINDIDASGEEALSLLVKRVRSAGVGFSMCGLKGQVINVMERTGLYDEIGRENLYADSRAAITALVEILHNATDLPAEGCANCPLTQYLPLEEEVIEEEYRAVNNGGSVLEKMFAATAFAEHQEFETVREILAPNKDRQPTSKDPSTKK
jgi:anti-anti-sigma regulatory factor